MRRIAFLAAAVVAVAPTLSAQTAPRLAAGAVVPAVDAEPRLAGRWTGVFVDDLTGTELPIAITSTAEGGYALSLTRPLATEAWITRARRGGVELDIAPYRDDALGVTITGSLKAAVSAYGLEGRMVLRTTDGRDVARGRVVAAREVEVARR
jgi:hypothetical protein